MPPLARLRAVTVAVAATLAAATPGAGATGAGQTLSPITVGADGSQPPGASTWSLRAYAPLSVIPEDEVVFAWTSLHSLFQLADAAAYAACDFTGSLQLAPAAPLGAYVANVSQQTTAFSSAPATTLYFTCDVPGHCSFGMKLQVNVVNATSNSTNSTTSAPTAVNGTASLPPAPSLNATSNGTWPPLNVTLNGTWPPLNGTTFNVTVPPLNWTAPPLAPSAAPLDVPS